MTVISNQGFPISQNESAVWGRYNGFNQTCFTHSHKGSCTVNLTYVFSRNVINTKKTEIFTYHILSLVPLFKCTVLSSFFFLLFLFPSFFPLHQLHSFFLGTHFSHSPTSLLGILLYNSFPSFHVTFIFILYVLLTSSCPSILHAVSFVTSLPSSVAPLIVASYVLSFKYTVSYLRPSFATPFLNLCFSLFVSYLPNFLPLCTLKPSEIFVINL